MTLSTFDCIAAITAHSAGFAEATRDNLEARVEHLSLIHISEPTRH